MSSFQSPFRSRCISLDVINARAPHPNAAKLWLEYLYSDEGQLILLSGYCHPARYDDLAKRDKIPAELLQKMPPVASYGNLFFPTIEQQNESAARISKKWDSVIAAGAN